MPDYPNLRRWAMPDSYSGAVWPATYSSGVGQSRDSSTLERSNFRSMLKALGGESETVEVVHEGHWAVGWVEWIAIHQDDETALAIADEIMGALADYPVIDEDDWSELEYETAADTWAQMSVADRVDAIQRHGCSENGGIFAARHAYLPGEHADPSGSLIQYLAE